MDFIMRLSSGEAEVGESFKMKKNVTTKNCRLFMAQWYYKICRTFTVNKLAKYVTF